MKYFFLTSLLLILLLTQNYAYGDVVNMSKKEKQFLSMLKSEHYRFKLLEKKQKAMAEAFRLEHIQKTLEKEIALKDEALIALKHEQLVLEQRIVEKKKRAQKLKKEKVTREKKKRLAALAKRNKVLAKIDLSQQRMRVYHKGKLLYNWKVSTGRKGHSTPLGHYKPTSIERLHRSKKIQQCAHALLCFLSFWLRSTWNKKHQSSWT